MVIQNWNDSETALGAAFGFDFDVISVVRDVDTVTRLDGFQVELADIAFIFC